MAAKKENDINDRSADALHGKAIRISGLGYKYGERRILEAIDLDIAEGCFTILLGRNGSGKSTLFRLIAGFQPLAEGCIEIFGTPSGRLSMRERAHILGFLPQHHRPVFPFRVHDVVLTGRAGHVRFLPGQPDLEKADEALVRAGIEHLGDRLFTELSGGEQQLVMLARILAQQPRIILLDEPISHLDLVHQMQVMTILQSLARDGYTVFAIIHDPNLATLYADRLVCLKNGRLLNGGEGALLSHDILHSLYGSDLSFLEYRGKNLVLPRVAIDVV